MNIAYSIKKLFRGKGEFTNEDLEMKIIKIFKYEWKCLSLINTPLYPTSFIVYLHNDDYKIMGSSFSFIVKDCIGQFNKIIQKKTKRKKGYVPHSKAWKFQFVPYTEGIIIDEVGEIYKGDPAIITQLLPEAVDSLSSKGRVVKSADSPHSKIEEKYEINPDVIKRLIYLGGDTFKVPFDFDEIKIERENTTIPKGRLKILGGVKFNNTSDTMMLTSNHIVVCGRNGCPTEQGEQLVCINDVNISNPHFHIIFNPDNRRFNLVADKGLTLNQRTIRKGDETALPHNSDIVLNNNVNLKFTTIEP